MTVDEAMTIMMTERQHIVGERFVASTLKNQRVKAGLAFFFCEQVTEEKIEVKWVKILDRKL